jgi:hypothetical protein
MMHLGKTDEKRALHIIFDGVVVRMHGQPESD